MSLVDKAFLIAENAHKNQMYGELPYVFHIHEVHQIAKRFTGSMKIEVAAILHDVIEDSTVSYNDINKHFGEEVAEIVYAVTDELGRNRKERREKTYPKIRESIPAQIVKLCDRLANISHAKHYNLPKFAMYKNEHQHFIDQILTEESLEYTPILLLTSEIRNELKIR